MRIFKSYPGWLWVLGYGFNASRLWAVLSIVLLVLVALLPAANVKVIHFLSEELINSGSVLLVLISVGVVFGAGESLRRVAYAVSRVNALRINDKASSQYDLKLAQASASLYESEEFMGIVRKARQCISEGYSSSQFQASVNIISAVITAGSLSLALYGLSPKAAAVSLLAPIPTSISYAWYGRQESRYWPVAAEFKRRSVYLQDQFSYHRTGVELSTMHATGALVSAASRSRLSYREIREKLEGKSIVADSLSGVFTATLFTISLVFLYRDTQSDTSAIFAGIVGLMGGVSAMAGIGYQIGELATSTPANRHLREFLTMDIGEVKRFTLKEIARLDVKSIDVSYGDFKAIRDVSFGASKGSLCALVGENGAGKTSLIKTLQGIQENAVGEIFVDDKELDVATSGEWFPFAVVQQDYGRYEVTVRDFLTLGIPRTHVTEEKITEALRFAEAEDFVRSLPHGLDSMLGVQWGGSELSGGQWQRLAIARAVLTDAPVWFLDEPTSAIDAPTEQRIFDRLAREAEKRIIILSSHRVSTLRAAENIIVLKEGSVCEVGDYATLMAAGTEFHRMFRSQLENL